MLRKLMSLSILGILVGSLMVGCSSGGNETPQTESDTKVEEKVDDKTYEDKNTTPHNGDKGVKQSSKSKKCENCGKNKAVMYNKYCENCWNTAVSEAMQEQIEKAYNQGKEDAEANSNNNTNNNNNNSDSNIDDENDAYCERCGVFAEDPFYVDGYAYCDDCYYWCFSNVDYNNDDNNNNPNDDYEEPEESEETESYTE